MSSTWRKLIISTLLLLLSFPVLCAQTQAAIESSKSTLIAAWLAVPGVDEIPWPYAFIRIDGTNEGQQPKRDDLFDQIDALHWRLSERGHESLAKAVTLWKAQLSRTRNYRLPGDWSPSWLMAHPNQRPPYDRVAAIGYCALPGYVQIWDSKGVHKEPWRSGLRLSDVMRADSALAGGHTDEVAVVSPEGEVDHYGVAAWNHANTSLSPGARIVGAIPLKGAVFPWMRDAIAGLLAHTPSGTQCREFPLSQRGGNE